MTKEDRKLRLDWLRDLYGPGVYDYYLDETKPIHKEKLDPKKCPVVIITRKKR